MEVKKEHKTWGMLALAESNAKSAELELTAALKDLEAAHAKVSRITDKVCHWNDAVSHLKDSGWTDK